ncbi:MAG: hypothetical protein HY788_01350 [Deltaproteobacteria bacterium]|nr:hypothetical protein [Deltaproteobacteria bacterium]
MGEIKSTLDLVLEKTRHLRLGDEEKREILREDAKKRARGYALKYVEGVWRLSQLLKTLGEEDPDPDVLEETVRTVVEQLRPGDMNIRLLDDLGEWRGDRAQDEIDGIRRELEAFERRERSLSDEIRERVIKELEGKGIYGSAVVPKIQHHAEWIEKNEQMILESNRVLEPLRNELVRRLLSGV